MENTSNPVEETNVENREKALEWLYFRMSQLMKEVELIMKAPKSATTYTSIFKIESSTDTNN